MPTAAPRRPDVVKVTPIPITVAPRCVECRALSATVYHSDGRYRCKPCNDAWRTFARRLRMSTDAMVGRQARRFR
jgi:tRNA(Ile2) C34 agmatinyltransferase TiaS